ncbi:MAG: T9SS type A sorting domain-containing protein, partial [Bacteroidota bacterium]
DCFVDGQKSAFVNSSISTFSMLDTSIWTFKTANGEVLGVLGSGSLTETVEFSFPGMDNYLVDLQVRNEVGCEGNVSKEIILKPIRTLTAAGYEENFNGESSDWISDSEGQYLSWIRDVPDFTGFNQVPDDLAWFTNLPSENSGYLEHSWIRSGCFDFSGMKNPVIKMDLMKSFTPGMDGAVLQYQDVVSEGWKSIGDAGEGINWYNATDLFHKPGGSSIGWGLDLFNPDHEWVNATHALDMVAGHPHVKFRVAIATGGTKEIEAGAYNQGFAFDNIFIGERIRKSLLEYFTNSSSIECKNADDVVDQFVINHSESVIDLQYHVDYPGVDPMNINNPYPPSTRAFNYGIQGVPKALLNGTIQFDFSDPSNVPNSDILKNASLETPLFDVDLAVNWTENSLEASVLTTCKSDTFNSNLQLYVAVIESEVTTYPGLNQDTIFRNVVLDLLPTPAGKLLGNVWLNGKTDSRSYVWDYQEYIEDIEDLAVVAFVLDRDHGQVLQVASVSHTSLVGKAVRHGETNTLAVYPNPAINKLYINFGSEVTTEGVLKIVDLSGSEVMRTDVRPGYSIINLNISHLSRGMYMIYWIRSGNVQARHKVIVTH